MPECEICGREFKGSGTVCKLCQFEEKERQRVTGELESSSGKPSPEKPVLLDFRKDNCPLCESAVTPQGYCESCQAVQLECSDCGRVNLFSPPNLTSATEQAYKAKFAYLSGSPPLKTSFTCASCHTASYHCPFCFNSIDSAGSRCNNHRISHFIFLDYIRTLERLNVVLCFSSDISKYHRACELKEGSEAPYMIYSSSFPYFDLGYIPDLPTDDTNWSFLRGPEQQHFAYACIAGLMKDPLANAVGPTYSLRETLDLFNASQDVRRILEYEARFESRPVTIIANCVNHLVKRYSSFLDTLPQKSAPSDLVLQGYLSLVPDIEVYLLQLCRIFRDAYYCGEIIVIDIIGVFLHAIVRAIACLYNHLDMSLKKSLDGFEGVFPDVARTFHAIRDEWLDLPRLNPIQEKWR